jgi:UrcA family protein
MQSITPARSVLAASILTLGLAFGTLCSAGEPAVTVGYGDLAITTSQGAKSLYRRIRIAADEVCSYLDHGDLSSKAHKSTCMDKVIADAVIRVGSPQLFSVYNAVHTTPLPAAFDPVASR